MPKRRNKRLTILFILLPFLLLGVVSFWSCLPSPLFNEPVSSILLSKQNKLLGAHISKDEQWRFPPLDNVPDKFATSIIAFEDKRFHRHIGVDPLAIARAIKLNLNAGRIVSGGSTLTMQVIRLAAKNPQRSFITKLIESFRALRLEISYSKEEILALYASYAPFGGNVVGLEAASWRYFSRSPQQLSWAESAMLAVLPNSPALIHPGRKREALKIKRDKLLRKLFVQNKITKLDYQLALTESLPIKPKPLPRLAPHLLDTLVAGKIGKLPPINTKDKKRFHTTLDAILQEKINRVANHHGEALALKDIHNLSILVIDNHSFEVKTYIGNTPTPLKDAAHGQAIDLIQRPRSTGSTLKPFLFASMLEQGEITPETLIADTPVRYTGYRPKNFDRKFRGAVRAKQALASSLNIPAVNMLSYHGIERFLATLKQMGMSTLHRRSREYGLPLILGGAEGTLWEITTMYANLANRALQSQENNKKFQQNYLQACVIKEGKITTSRKNEISPASAWMTLQALLEVSRPGNDGYWKRFNSTHKIAWKTGTSFGHRDAWAVGTTPQYTVGIWVGNAEGEGRQGMTGVRVAAPILFDVFNRLPLKPEWFKKPREQMKTVSICKNDGFLANQHCDAKDYLIPENSHFDRISPYHLRIHLDPLTQTRVHGGCHSINKMLHKSWFVLPPDQAVFYQQNNFNYQPLPEWKKGCEINLTDSKAIETPISLIYPRNNTQIFIPKELSGKQGKTLFSAMHKNPDAKIFWHLDNEFLGTTQTFHEQAITASLGKHQLTLVDALGNTVRQGFSVLSH